VAHGHAAGIQSVLRLNAPGGLSPEFRVISELLGYLRRSAIRREGGPVELADHQRCRAADTLELVHDRLSERHVEDARLHPTYNVSPRPSKHTGEHLDPAVVFRVPLACVIDPLLIILDAVEIRLSLKNELLIDLKIWPGRGLFLITVIYHCISKLPFRVLIDADIWKYTSIVIIIGFPEIIDAFGNVLDGETSVLTNGLVLQFVVAPILRFCRRDVELLQN
jgi:hypothetical protein